MSHAINNMVFDINTPKSKMQKAADDWGNKERDHQECGWGYKGVDSIDFTSKIFPNQEAADGYCYAQGYRICAVRFHLPPKESPTVKKLKERVQRLYREYQALYSANKFSNYKSSRATCKCCGSSINTDYLRNPKSSYDINTCPVCGQSMLSPSEAKRIEVKKAAYDKAYAELKRQINEDAAKNDKLAWMVHVEVHS